MPINQKINFRPPATSTVIEKQEPENKLQAFFRIFEFPFFDVTVNWPNISLNGRKVTTQELKEEFLSLKSTGEQHHLLDALLNPERVFPPSCKKYYCAEVISTILETTKDSSIIKKCWERIGPTAEASIIFDRLSPYINFGSNEQSQRALKVATTVALLEFYLFYSTRRFEGLKRDCLSINQITTEKQAKLLALVLGSDIDLTENFVAYICEFISKEEFIYKLICREKGPILDRTTLAFIEELTRLNDSNMLNFIKLSTLEINEDALDQKNPLEEYSQAHIRNGARLILQLIKKDAITRKPEVSLGVRQDINILAHNTTHWTESFERVKAHVESETDPKAIDAIICQILDSSRFSRETTDGIVNQLKVYDWALTLTKNKETIQKIVDDLSNIKEKGNIILYLLKMIIYLEHGDQKQKEDAAKKVFSIRVMNFLLSMNITTPMPEIWKRLIILLINSETKKTRGFIDYICKRLQREWDFNKGRGAPLTFFNIKFSSFSSKEIEYLEYLKENTDALRSAGAKSILDIIKEERLKKVMTTKSAASIA